MSGTDLAPYETGVRSHAFVGKPGTGKTERMVHEVESLLLAGVSPDEIVFFAATPLACESVRARLSGSDAASSIPLVTTVREYALSILGSEAALRSTGRAPRILLRFEESFLLEDLKTSGVQPRRLSKMLEFFYRSMSELEPMDGSWFFDDEEARVLGMLKRYLDCYGAYASAEVAREAFELMSRAPGQLEDFRRDFVFVDDYQTLSKASQCLTAAITAQELWIANDELSCVETLEAFPHAEGLARFVEANEDCEMVELFASHKSRDVADIVDAIRRDAIDQGDLDEAVAQVEERPGRLLEFRNPADEFSGVADLVEREIQAGIAPHDIGVAAVNSTWARNVAETLEARGVPVSRIMHFGIGGDIRDVCRCAQARIFTLLSLAADHTDQFSLRCWCGFGDHLANSGLIARVVERSVRLNFEGTLAEGLVVSGHEASRKTEESPSSGFFASDALCVLEEQRVQAALAQLRRMLSNLDGLTGYDLVRGAYEAICPDGDDAVRTFSESLLDGLSPDASAEEICAHARMRCALPYPEGRGVHVGLIDDFVGMQCRSLVLCGLVNGFIPSRDYFDPTVVERDKRPVLLDKELRRIEACIGAADERVALSYFVEASLREAEMLKLKISRIRLMRGQRVCELHPSEAIRSVTGKRFEG